jgi:hypothetical protein
LAPLVDEDEKEFRPSAPGRLGDGHRRAFAEIADRAYCVAAAEGIDPSAVLITVYPGTDDRPARTWINSLLKKSGADDADIGPIADALANVVASHTRGMLVVTGLRDEIRAGARGGGAAPVVALSEYPAEAPAPTGELREGAASHPRSFTVVIRGSRDAARPASAAPVAAATPLTMNVDVTLPDRASGSKANGSKHAFVWNLGLAHVWALGADHLGGSLLFAYKHNGRYDDDEHAWGVMPGARVRVVLSDDMNRLSNSFSAAALPQLEGYLGVWRRFPWGEARLALLAGGILPRAGFLGEVEPSLVLRLPSDYEVFGVGSVGTLMGSDTSAVWAWGIGIGRTY